MSEPFLKSRPAAGGYDEAGRRSAAPAGREDPLAELARLVGKDDPFRAATARQPAPNVSRFPQSSMPEPQRQPAAPLAAEDDGIGDYHEPGYPDFDAELRGSIEGRAAASADEAARPRDALRFSPMPETDPSFDPSLDAGTERPRGEAPPLNADLWAEGTLPQEDEPASFAEAGNEEIERSSRRTMAVLAAVVVLVGGGLGATLAMRGSSGTLSSNGTPPTIAASDTPVKVQSPDMANGGGADANTALLEKADSDKVDHAKVATNNEQPLDLNQLPKPSAPQADAGQSAPPSSSASANGFPEPRKVKTVMIRPDGSLVDAAPQPAPASPVGMVMPAGADGDNGSIDTPAPSPVAKPTSPKSTARVTSTPKDAAASGGASGAKQAAAPAHALKPKPPAPVAEADATPAEEAPAAAPGTWSVQLAAPATEQDAKDTAARLQKKFADALGGSKLSVRKATDKAVYRVRVSNLSQDDAKALCGKLQAAGGSCFPVRN